MLTWIRNTYRLACAARDVRRAQARYAKLRRLRLGVPNDPYVMIAEAHALADMHAAILHWEGLRHG